MLDIDSCTWSVRRTKMNFHMIRTILCSMVEWLEDICTWKKPSRTIAVYVCFSAFVWFPDMVLSLMFLMLFLLGVWNYRFRPKHPPHVDVELSYANTVTQSELDEEFDTFPCNKIDVLRSRYLRIANLGSIFQDMVGSFATQLEKISCLLSWRDPRATALFLVFCVMLSLVLFFTPLKVVLMVVGLYVIRPPSFREGKLPSYFINYLKRLPSRNVSLL